MKLPYILFLQTFIVLTDHKRRKQIFLPTLPITSSLSDMKATKKKRVSFVGDGHYHGGLGDRMHLQSLLEPRNDVLVWQKGEVLRHHMPLLRFYCSALDSRVT